MQEVFGSNDHCYAGGKMRKRSRERAKHRILKPRKLVEYIEDCRSVDLAIGSNRHAHNVLPQLADLGCPAHIIAGYLATDPDVIVSWYEENIVLPLRVYEALLHLLMLLAEHSYNKDRGRQQIHNCRGNVCQRARNGLAEPTIRDVFLEYIQAGAL